MDWTPSAVSVNLSLSERPPNQIQTLRWGHKSRRGYAHGHARARARRETQHTRGFFSAGLACCSCVALSEWCPGGCGEAERGLSSSAVPLFTLMVSRCSLVIGALRNAGEQPSSGGACASKPGLRQLYLGCLGKKTRLCFVITPQLFPRDF